MSVRIIGVINQKGGVGKTTTSVNLSAALASAGKKVLAIDLDPQANMSTHLGLGLDAAGQEGGSEDVGLESFNSVYEVLDGQKTLGEVVVNRSENLDVVASSLLLSSADLTFGGVVGRELMLKRAVATLQNDYDFIIIDCPPSLGLLSLNVLAAVHEVIIPVQSEYLALHGVRQLLDTIDEVRSVYNENLNVGGVVICLHDSRKKLNRAVSDTIHDYFGHLVYNTVVRTNVSLAEAPAQGETIFEYSPKSTGAEDYSALAEEVLNGQKED